MFSTPESKALSDRYVAVKVTGGKGITPEVKEFMQRYGVQGYPTLMVMNSKGHRVVNGMGRTVDGMLEALEKGEAKEKEFAELKAKTDAESKTAYKEELFARAAYEDLEPMVAAAMAGEPSVDAYGDHVRVLRGKGDRDGERAAIGEMLEKFPKADDRVEWRIRLINMDGEGATSREEFVAKRAEVLANLESLAEEVDADESLTNDQRAAAHVPLIGMFAQQRNLEEARVHLDWVLENAPKSKYAPGAHMWNVQLLANDGEWKKAHDVLQMLLTDFPEAEETKTIVPRALKFVLGKMEEAGIDPNADGGDGDDGGDEDDDDDL